MSEWHFFLPPPVIALWAYWPQVGVEPRLIHRLRGESAWFDSTFVLPPYGVYFLPPVLSYPACLLDLW